MQHFFHLHHISIDSSVHLFPSNKLSKRHWSFSSIFSRSIFRGLAVPFPQNRYTVSRLVKTCIPRIPKVAELVFSTGSLWLSFKHIFRHRSLVEELGGRGGILIVLRAITDIYQSLGTCLRFQKIYVGLSENSFKPVFYRTESSRTRISEKYITSLVSW